LLYIASHIAGYTMRVNSHYSIPFERCRDKFFLPLETYDLLHIIFNTISTKPLMINSSKAGVTSKQGPYIKIFLEPGKQSLKRKTLDNKSTDMLADKASLTDQKATLNALFRMFK
jgi:hypothetical protein